MQKMYSCSHFTASETKIPKNVSSRSTFLQRAFFDLVPHESVKCEQLEIHFLFFENVSRYNGSV